MTPVRTVMLVEDEMYLAMMLQDVLEDAGYAVLFASRVEQALALAASAAIDAAILDINVDGSEVFPVAEALLARDIPFMFASGYGDQRLPAAHTSTPTLQKPYRPAMVCDLVQRLIESRPGEIQAAGSKSGDAEARLDD
jgi:DNA-binding response OmpR family regulator